MTTVRIVLAVCALALGSALVVAGCGGDDASDRDPREVVERTFDNDTDVTSGVVDLALGGTMTGEESGSFSATLAGSFQTEDGEERKLPQVDLDAAITGEGGGDSIDEAARLTVTEDNAFVEYDGETYEAGEEMFASLRDELETQVEEAGVDEGRPFQQACEQALRQAGGDPAGCDINITEDWLTNLENEGTEDVEGAETIHVSGDLDVERMLVDVAELARSVPGFSLEGLDPAQLAPAVPEASFDLYSGVDDEELRRLEFRIVIEPAAVTGGLAVVPVERIEVDFSFTMSELNEPQTIEAPTGPTTPLGRLLGGLGPGALGGGLGGLPDLEDDGGPDDSEPAPTSPDDGAGGEDLEDLDPDQAQEYLDCIQEAAQSGDQEAFNACAEQL